MIIREDSIIFLLGAGASVDAGIMHAKSMTEDIEKKIINVSEYRSFEDLYNYLKSSILYQRGLNGDFENTDVNIEDLLNVLSDLKLKNNNKLYPFIGSWNVQLQRVAGKDFEYLEALDTFIRRQLFDWINIESYDKSSYFTGFAELANEVGVSLRVFTLNYDLCVEKALAKESMEVEIGFNRLREWEASRFDSNPTEYAKIFLYKLHGSIDWKRDPTLGGVLKYCDTPRSDHELIFGTPAKLTSIDPYLFYVHEFRKYSLQEPLRFIIAVGYSFGDEYINRLISQAVSRNNLLTILSISPDQKDRGEIDKIRRDQKRYIAQKLNIDTGRVQLINSTAKEFFTSRCTLEFFESIGGQTEEAPF